MPLIPGDVVLERYRVDDLLAQGGMSAVYRAWDVRLDAPCALKEMVPYPGMDERALSQLREQFFQEARVLRDLVHPNMPRVFDHFEWDGNAYLVMDYVEGQSLAGIIDEEGKIPLAILKGWARELIDGLNYCHQQGVLHRDVKPQNVMLTPLGEVSLVDFGLAKLMDIEDRQTRTVMRGLGTPEYAPPEQYDAEPGSTDARSDIYSLGATLYHALTGTPPPTATQRIVDPGLLKPIRHFSDDVPEYIDDAIIRALSLQPGQRFQTVNEMGAALLGEPTAKSSSKPLGSGAPQASDPRSTVLLATISRMPRLRMWAGVAGGSLILLVAIFTLTGGFSFGATATVTSTVTATLVPPTATSTPSATPTASATPTPTATRTAVATSAPTATSTATATNTPTSTPTLTPTATQSATPTPTATATPTPTATATPTRRPPTQTPTPTSTPTATQPPPPPPTSTPLPPPTSIPPPPPTSTPPPPPTDTPIPTATSRPPPNP